MKALAAILEKLDDRINPIAVKELRQAVVAKYISGLLLLFLLGQLVVMGVFTVNRPADELSHDAGMHVLVILLVILSGTCSLLVPVYCGVRMAIERARWSTELYAITGLRARSIVWGKLSSGFMLTVLIVSACAPFLVFSYLLRGVDLALIFRLLFGVLLSAAVSILAAVLIGAFPVSIPFKVLIGILWIGRMFIPWVMIVLRPRIAWHVWMLIGFGFRFSVTSAPAWQQLVLSILMSASTAGLYFVWCVAMLSPPSANRALPVRVYITAAWLVVGVASFFFWREGGPYSWGYNATQTLSVMLLAAVCERESPGHRVARTIPRGRQRRRLAFLFYSGASGGVVWATLMLALTLLVCLTAAILSGPFSGQMDYVAAMWPMPLAVFAAALTALLLRKTTTFRKLHRRYTWLVAAGILVPIAFVSAITRGATTRGTSLVIMAIWAAAVAAASVPWFIENKREFDRAAAAAAADAPGAHRAPLSSSAAPRVVPEQSA